MSKLMIIFPGIGYTPDKPLLYYGRKTAEKAGYECLAVSYDFHGDKGKIRGNAEKMQEVFQELYAQTKEALKDVDLSSYEEVLFLSKSVGTVIAAAYAKELQASCPEQENETRPATCPVIRQVFYTPLEATFSLASGDSCEPGQAYTSGQANVPGQTYAPGQAIGFLGTADPWSDPKEVLRLAGLWQVPMNVYEKANHSLETGDIGADLDILKDVAEKTGKFLNRS